MDDAPRPLYLLLAWLALNLLQAGLSPLDPDETYYWMYAGQLDWGYFDHPPAVALLIALGRDWLPGALGLRLGHVLTGTATLVGLYYLLDRPRGKDLNLAAALIFAQPLLHVYGFIATPDGPLLLFTVLYLLAFRRFIATPTLRAGLWWGLTMTGLLYSKYHGVLIITFSVLPLFIWLIRQPGAWVAALGGALLFTPHLYWQYLNDFPSFRYHLSGRNDAYWVVYTLQYLRDQLLVFSPFLAYHYARTLGQSWSREEAFARCCRWLTIGVALFFLYSTSRGRAEAHWTALLSVPLVYLLYRTVKERFPAWRTPVVKLALLSGGLLVLARLLLMAPREWLPFNKPFDHAPWVAELSEIAGGHPVFFENSYRLASLYTFYSGNRPAWTFTDVDYRPNQYDLWRGDEAWQDTTVLVAGQLNWEQDRTSTFRAGRTELHLREVPDFQVAAPTKLSAEVVVPPRLTVTDEAPLTLRAASPYTLYLRSRLPLHPFAILRYSTKETYYWRLPVNAAATLPANDTTVVFRGNLSIPATAPRGEALLEFGLGYEGMPPLSGQSDPIPVSIGPE